MSGRQRRILVRGIQNQTSIEHKPFSVSNREKKLYCWNQATEVAFEAL